MLIGTIINNLLTNLLKIKFIQELTQVLSFYFIPTLKLIVKY